jgi:DNA polymerase-3 subunit epsilon
VGGVSAAATPWSPTWYAFDVESTGVDVFNDRIVTATVVKVENGKAVDKRTWLVDPGIEIPAGAAAVHGITTEHARQHGEDPAEAVPAIGDTVVKVLRAGLPLVVFNAAYDLSLLDVEVDRYGDRLTNLLEPEHWHRVVDPFVLGKGFDHLYKRKFTKGWKYTLQDLCDRYGVPLTESHDATADATAACLLGIELVRADSYFQQQAPEQIHTLQRTWRREMQASLRRYFEREGIEHDGCDGGWPLHTQLVPAVAR